MTRAIFAFLFFFLPASRACLAQESDSMAGLEPYRSQQTVTGTIRIRGNNFAAPLMKLWQDGFQKQHPNVSFDTKLDGSETAIASLYSGTADLGFLGREVYEPEKMAFREWFGYEPLGIEITTGSYNIPHKSFALMIFVHDDNPLGRITISQLAETFGCEQSPRGGRRSLTWAQLGLTGDWATRPIHVYGYGIDSGFARFLAAVTFHGNYRWNPEMTEFYNTKATDGSDIDSGQLILDALRKDPDGIAYSNVAYESRDLKTLSVATTEDGPFVAPTKESVGNRTYPITRFTTVFVNRIPGKPLEPKAREFLRYILSRDGQEIVAQEGSYLPLTPDVVRDQLRQME